MSKLPSTTSRKTVVEHHKQKMVSKRNDRLTGVDRRGPAKLRDHEPRLVRFKKWFDRGWAQQQPGYNRSIWPDGKVAQPGRMA